jgi:PAS domain S-box-containing protein
MNLPTLTLRRAIILAVALGLLLPAILIIGFSWFQRYDKDIQKRTEELLDQNANVLANSMQESLWNVDRESGAALLESMMRNEDIVRIEVLDNTLGIFVASERRERRRGYTAARKQTIIYRKTPIGSIVIEVTSTRTRQIILEGLRDYFFALTAQIALALILILWLLDQRLIRPLRRLSFGAENLAKGTLDTPFTWKRLDEIGLLSQRMEATRISLRQLFEQLEQKNQELEKDIEHRKRIEHELREREARFRALVEQSPLAIIEWDLAWHVIEWNAAAERIFGYTRAEALGQHANFLLQQQDRGQTVFSAFIDEQSAVTNNLRADGKMIVCQWNNRPIANDSGSTERLLSMTEDITEKCHAEEAQHLSETKFSGAFQLHPDSISITRLSDGSFLDANRSFEQTTGYSLAELRNKAATDLNIWVNPIERHQLLDQLKEQKTVRDMPWNMRTKQGEIRKCLINATTFNIANDTFMLAVTRDITEKLGYEEQKAQADSALLRLAQGTQGMGSEAFYQLLVTDLALALHTDQAFIGLRVANEQNHIRTIANFVQNQITDNYEYAFPGTPCEVALKGEFAFFPKEAAKLFPQDISLTTQAIEGYAAASLRDATGNHIGILGVMHSKPLNNPELVKSLLQVFSERASSELERKRAEEALLNSERSFSSIFHSSPVAMSVIRIDHNCKVKDVNNAFERLFMLPRASVIGRTTTELGLYADASVPTETLFHQTDTHEHYESWMNRSDGRQIFVQISQNSFSLMGEHFITVVFEDITEKFNNELAIHDLNVNLEHRVVERTNALQQANKELASTLETLKRTQEDLVRSEKLAALGSLVAGIAHELNTPIGNTLMVATTLIDQTDVFSVSFESGLKRSALEGFIHDVSRAGDIMVRNLRRAADLVTSFKQVAVDQTSSQRRQFNLAEVVGEIVLTLWPLLKKTVFTVVQEIDEEITMDSYPGPLGQILTNLVNNALIHGFEGRTTGTILITGRLIGSDWVELCLSDDGIGITPDNLKHIYDPFFTTKMGSGGTGLGLNIAHNIMSGVLGGKIGVQSEVGQGTKFTLTLPRDAPVTIQAQHEDKTFQAKPS